jgi:hypothetical protein
MRSAGLLGASHRRGGSVTTHRDDSSRPAPDLVDRNFTASGPNQLWVADITLILSAKSGAFGQGCEACDMRLGARCASQPVHDT